MQRPPIEQETDKIFLQRLLITATDEGLKSRIRARLDQLRVPQSVFNHQDQMVKKARMLYLDTQDHKQAGSADPRSVKYAAQGFIKRRLGKTWTGMMAGFASYATLAKHLGLPPLAEIIREYPFVSTVAGLLYVGWGISLFAIEMLDEVRGTFRRA